MLSKKMLPLVGRQSKRSHSSPHRHHQTRRLLLEGLEERRMLTFMPAMDYPTGAKPQAVVAADFNNDTIPDIAVALNTSHEVSVLLGKADGTFQPPLNSATGSYPRSLAAGDFNDDGILDLASANGYAGEYSGDGNVSILLGTSDGTNKGTGSFETAANAFIGDTPESVAVGDFNGDGRLDLGVLANYGWSGYGSAHVLLGDGVGGFSAQNRTDLSYGSHISAAVADFNGDGVDDFATANEYEGTVRVLLNNGSGELQPATDFNVDMSATRVVAAGDVNGDGHIDLVSADDDVGVLLGDGSGGFGSAGTYAVGAGSTSIVLADFTHDGHLDVATTNYLTYEVSVLSGEGDGTFSTPTFAAVASYSYPFAIAAGDFNGDTWLDAVTANYYGNSISVLINDQAWPNPPFVRPSLAIADPATVLEGNSGAVATVFTVTRSGDLSSTATVSYSTANGGALAGSDYVAASGMLTFAPGEATQTITVVVNGDLIDEWDQGFYVNLSAASGAIITDSQAFGLIVDNDPPPTITITPIVSAKEGNNGSTLLFNFVVTLSAPSEKGVRVNFATADGTATTADGDYIAKSGTLVFAPGTTSKTISVQVRSDKKKEANERFYVNLSGATNATIAAGQGVGDIVNDDNH